MDINANTGNSDKYVKVVANALNEFDKNKMKYLKFFSEIEYYVIDTNNNDQEHNTIIFFDKQNEEIFRSRYEHLGIYNNYVRSFIWSWADYTKNKNETSVVRKLLQYGLNILFQDDIFFFKNSLISSKLNFDNLSQLNYHIAICTYLIKQPLIFESYTRPFSKESRLSSGVTIDKKFIRKRYDIINRHIDDPIYSCNYLILLDHDKIPKKYL